MSQFSRNFPALSHAQQLQLQNSHVLVVGCGGLGGSILETLARLGVGELTVVDSDRLEVSNLNRQILATHEAIGQSKVSAAEARVKAICPTIRFHGCEHLFSPENALELLSGKDLVMDALDNIPDRLILEEFCAQTGLTIIHGAVQGWTAQVSVIPPGSGLLTRLYAGKTTSTDKSCLGFTPTFCASLQCAEAVKFICGEASELSGRLLLADLRSTDFEVLAF